jgi:hypothetical protein
MAGSSRSSSEKSDEDRTLGVGKPAVGVTDSPPRSAAALIGGVVGGLPRDRPVMGIGAVRSTVAGY